MRTGVSPSSLSSSSNDSLEERPAPTHLVLARITATELALKLRSGQLGPLTPCRYSPARHTIKVLSMG